MFLMEQQTTKEKLIIIYLIKSDQEMKYICTINATSDITHACH